MHWFIDNQGEAWPATSVNLRRKVFATKPLTEISNSLVTNLGYIAIEVSVKAIHIRWRATFVKKESLVGLILFLADLPDQRVVVWTFEDTWKASICGSIAQARDTLLHVFSTARCQCGGDFRAIIRDIASLSDGSPLKNIALLAREPGRSIAPSKLWHVLQNHAGGRYILLRLKAIDERLKIVSVGAGYIAFGKTWPFDSVGKDFCDQPDEVYANFAAMSLVKVAKTGVPTVEDVRASTWWPERGRSLVQYTRLILPVRVDNGQNLILSSVQGGRFI